MQIFPRFSNIEEIEIISIVKQTSEFGSVQSSLLHDLAAFPP